MVNNAAVAQIVPPPTNRQYRHQLQTMRTTASAFAPPVDAAQAKSVVWFNPRLVAQVKYGAWTSAGRLRHPAFKALRADKLASVRAWLVSGA